MHVPSALFTPSRRTLLRYALTGAGALIVAPWLSARSRTAAGASERPAPALGPPDANGVRSPPGFTSRVVARSGKRPVPSAPYVWHGSPDGGATFATEAGGWVYVSNSELDGGKGGVGALRFAADGSLVAAYPICTGTTRNCAGGATPWGTWLSCEEYADGRVWECDPRGAAAAVARPALGTFTHEAAAVDAAHGCLYLTEDQPDGRWYRFRPTRPAVDGRLPLDAGVLEVAQVADDGKVSWHPIPDPGAATRRTALQVADSTAFNGGEGICLHAGMIYFATKGDDRVWAYDTTAETLRVFYDRATNRTPELQGVDNLAVAPTGDIVVAEDGGDMQIVALRADGTVAPIVQIVGHRDSEIAGPAFDPAGQRLYFSSQRGPDGSRDSGITFEVSGPFASL